MGKRVAMLTPTVVLELLLTPGQHPEGGAWLSATSGLVCIASRAYVVADDEHHLAHFGYRNFKPAFQ